MNRLVAAMIALAAVLGAAGCGSGAPRTPSPGPSSVADTQTPRPAVTSTIVSPPPPATPTPAPPLHADGRAVYSDGADLRIVALDGGDDRALSEGGYRCGAGCRTGTSYAGAAVVGGRAWQYFTYAVAPAEPQAYALPSMRFVLARRPAEGGPEEELRRFDGFTNSDANASVSRDGQHVAYVAVDGLHRFDPATGVDALLLANVTDCTRIDSTGGRCVIYSDPRWSPDGATLLVREGYDEGARPLLLDPLAERPAPVRLDVGGRFQEWSPDGTRLCMSEDGYDGGPGGVFLVGSRDPGAFINLTGRLGGAAVMAASCAWSADGARVAFSYWRRAIGQPDSGGIAIFSVDGSLVRDIALMDPHMRIAGWLPDGSGVITSSAAGEGVYSAAVLVDGTTRRLPAALEMHEVQAVLP